MYASDPIRRQRVWIHSGSTSYAAPGAAEVLVTPPPTSVEFYATRKQLAKQVGRGLLLVATSAFCLSVDDMVAKVVGVIGLLLFVPVGLAHVVRLAARSNEPDIVIDDRGVRDYIRGWDVPWEAVQGVWETQTYKVRLLCFDVAELSNYRREPRGLAGWVGSRVARTNRYFGFSDAVLAFGDVEPGIEEAIAAIREARPGLWPDSPAAV